MSKITQAERHYTLAGSYMIQEKYKEAEDEFRLAIESNPSYALAYYGLGTLYFSKMGRVEEAISIFKEGISKVPSEKRLYLGLSSAYIKSGDLDNAEKATREILLIDPNDTNAQQNLELIHQLKERSISKNAIVQTFKEHDKYSSSEQTVTLDQLNRKESAALVDLRTLYAACQSYRQVFHIYPRTLKMLSEKGWISQKLSDDRGSISGYYYYYSLTTDKDSFEIFAVSGPSYKKFYIDETGIIKLNDKFGQVVKLNNKE